MPRCRSAEAAERNLPGDFVRLRAALKPLVGGDLSRVVYVSYGNPALQGADLPRRPRRPRRPSGVHRRWRRLENVTDFVLNRFLPRLKALALCEAGECADPATDRMTFVDAHQAAFATHGICVALAGRSAVRPRCFSPKGDSFDPIR